MKFICNACHGRHCTYEMIYDGEPGDVRPNFIACPLHGTNQVNEAKWCEQ